MHVVVFLCLVSVAYAEYMDEPVKPGKGSPLPSSYPERPEQYVANDASPYGIPPQADAAGESSEDDDDEFDGSPLSDAAKLKAAPKPAQPRPPPKPEPKVSNTGVRVSKTNQGLKQNQIGIVRGGNTRNVVNAPNTVNIDLRNLQKTNQNTQQGNAQVAPQNDVIGINVDGADLFDLLGGLGK
ncbi:hypothetical protein Y032_0132g1724 [Ancylostoma ceylanicum]|uniref:Uncharacterized protein n=1 Tax=Ancylostoma ceylanicum TaxID=53326 RepID=A0A016T6H6_9BILA|nr:hypothetical protein Y032_0132g1724 [Ancylostoma ceylanicum]